MNQRCDPIVSLSGRLTTDFSVRFAEVAKACWFQLSSEPITFGQVTRRAGRRMCDSYMQGPVRVPLYLYLAIRTLIRETDRFLAKRNGIRVYYEIYPNHSMI